MIWENAGAALASRLARKVRMLARMICLLLAVVSSVVWTGFTAEAEQATKVPRLGILWPRSADDSVLEAFRQGMRELGYVEGRNVAIEYRFAESNNALLPGFAADLVRREVDVIVTWGVPAARFAIQATTTIPIVNGSMSDPVRAKLVASLARPGGNLTGFTSGTPELSGKLLELIRESVPGLSRLAVLSTESPSARLGLAETEIAAKALGLTLLVYTVREPADFAPAFAAMVSAGAQGLIMLADTMIGQHRERLVRLTAEHRLPAASFDRGFVTGGGLMSYSPNYSDLFRRAAVYVDKILKGARPGDLPIERVATLELVINLKTAKALGLDLPPAVLARADEVIE